MLVTAWNNGKNSKSGSGYGVKLTIEDRDRFFDKSWETVDVLLPNGIEITVNTKKQSFWNGTCRELIHHEIGKWLFHSGLAPWPKGKPPNLILERIGEGRFHLQKRDS